MSTHGLGLGSHAARSVKQQVEESAWWSEPQPSIPELRTEALEAAWTTSNRARMGRVVWLYAVTVPGRIPPWLAHRMLFGSAPRFGSEQPPLRDVCETWVARAVLVPARAVSWVADYAHRTAVAVLFVWLLANAANEVPVVHAVVPDAVTAGYWWQVITGAISDATDSAQTTAHDTLPSGNLSDLVVFALIVIAAAVWAFVRLHNRKDQP